jgi:SAM-dependent methyltransferase
MHGYASRVEAERRHYADNRHVHDLPPICFYWLNRYILPQLASLGYTSADRFFLSNLQRAYERSPREAGRARRFLSIGAGNCDTEVRIAGSLLESGMTEFVIDCLDLNADMLERGKASAAENGLTANINPICDDFNAWRPEKEYDAILANQVLHHVVELETLLDAARSALTPGGPLIVSDMIGRNGHRRWPEALEHVERFWRELPASYRYNRQLQKMETGYPDWDCSAEGFEGIRSQDILPLLIDRFHFDFFYAFANVIDPFIDRGFGPNFNAEGEWDRAFIDRAHACDESGISSGQLKPTHMLAILTAGGTGNLVCRDKLTPEFCVRYP